MKTFAVPVIFLVLIGTAWVLYLEYSNRRFVEDLRPPPESLSIGKKKASMSNNSEEVNLSEAKVSSSESEDIAGTDEAPYSGQVPRQEVPMPIDLEDVHAYEASHESDSEMVETSVVDLRPPPGMSLAAWMDSLTSAEKQEVYQQKPWLKPIQEMTLQEVETEVARRKQRLIDKFGNTPEVQIINRYTTVPFLLGEPQKLTGDETVEQARAMSVLWPTKENIDYYRGLKALQENGWHVDPQ